MFCCSKKLYALSNHEYNVQLNYICKIMYFELYTFSTYTNTVVILSQDLFCLIANISKLAA